MATVFTKKTIELRQKNVSHHLLSVMKDDEALIIFSGNPIQKPGGLDQTYAFLPLPTYFWLSGRRRANEALFYSKSTGWLNFQNPINLEESYWEGESVECDSNMKITELPDFIKKTRLKNVFSLGEKYILNSAEYSIDNQKNNQRYLDIKKSVDEVRRIKDDEEVQLIKKNSCIAEKGFQKIKSLLQPGISERALQIEYEAEIFRQGAEKVPYDTIIGSGKNSSILHAIPSSKLIEKNDLVLVDAGSDLFDYCVDVTRVFHVEGKLDSKQKIIFDLVSEAQKKCIAACKADAYSKDIHEISARVIAEGLIQHNLIFCSVDEALESELISVFYPHGVGHLVGLRVRDVGYEENLNPQKYFGSRLRVDLKLQKNMLLTVEPGCYFIHSLLSSKNIYDKHKSRINFSEVEKWSYLGGVRIEDDILITEKDPINLTENITKAV